MDWFNSIKDQLVTTLLDSIKDKANEFVEKTVTKTTDIIGVCIALCFIFFAFGLFILFAGIGLALLISEWTGKIYAGFLILGIIYLICGWLFWVLRKKLIGNPLKKVIMKSVKGN